MLTPTCRKTEQKQFSFECKSPPLPDTLKSNFIPWLLQFCRIKVILLITLICSQYCHLAGRASERYGNVLISIQLPMEYKPQHKAEIRTAELLQWSHTSSSMAPLPQIKPFLQITLYPGPTHTIYASRSPGTRGQFCFPRNTLRYLLTNRDKASF